MNSISPPQHQAKTTTKNAKELLLDGAPFCTHLENRNCYVILPQVKCEVVSHL